MSIHENLQCYPALDIARYLAILTDLHRAEAYPDQPDIFIVDGLPCYKPRQAEDHTFVLSFKDLPLPDILLQVLIEHPVDFPDNIRVCWTQEQELILDTTLAELR